MHEHRFLGCYDGWYRCSCGEKRTAEQMAADESWCLTIREKYASRLPSRRFD